MAKKNKKLPKTLHVYREHDPSDHGTTWFTAYERIYDCGEMGEKRTVGIYRLQETVQVEPKVEIIRDKS